MFSKKLINWYKANARDLPWRRTRDPYKIWISEIMLQQTTVAAVIPYYERWVSEFPSIDNVAKASLKKILKFWQGMGYYSRAKNIHKTAQIIVEKYKGRIPKNQADLKGLPGFGPYTIGAVLSIAFDRRHPIVDANVRRVVMRQIAIRGHADASHDKKIYQFLETVMPHRENGIFSQALMELGALICRNHEPVCISCPVKESCLAHQKSIQKRIPTPKKKMIKKIDAVIAVINKNGKYFIQKRPSKGLFADLWEFPGGKVETGESIPIALDREIREELDTNVRKAKYLMNLTHFYTQFRVKLHVFDCELESAPSLDRTHKWVSLNALKNYPMPSGSAKIVEKLSNIHK